MADKSQGYIPGLDGLRAIAVVSVALFHFAIHDSGHIDETGRQRFVSWGWAGVDLFFVLSGFLITGILLRSRGNLSFLAGFYRRRALRIAPAYYFYAVFSLSVAGLATLHMTPADAVSVFLFASNLRSGQMKSFGHFWSLAVEAQFYLAWPLLVRHASDKALMRVCLLGPAVALALRFCFPAPAPEAYYLTPLRMDGLLLGAFIALASRDHRVWARVKASLPTAAVVAVVAFLLAGRANPLAITAASVGSACVLVAALECGWLCRMLETRPLAQIGRLSYGMYIWHMLAISLAYEIPAGPAIRLLAALAGSVAVAAFSLRYIERPFLRARRAGVAVEIAAA